MYVVLITCHDAEDVDEWNLRNSKGKGDHKGRHQNTVDNLIWAISLLTS